MIARTPARFLAPIALIAVVVAAVLAINRASSDSGRPSTTQTAPLTRRHVPRVYRVRAGDTLPGISRRFGVPVNTILALNTEVDPRSLNVGHRLRLR